VLSDGTDQAGVDESVPYPEQPFNSDFYYESKALWEQAVVNADGHNGLLTASMRVAGLFGYIFVYQQTQISLMD
jgi:sterol-4alpha-carboxylate 3-dehydrogenase (decarboxylating)